MPLPNPSVSIINMRKLDDGRYMCDLKLENYDDEIRIFIMDPNDTTREIYQFTNIEFTEDNLPAFYLFYDSSGSNISGKSFLELFNDPNIKVASIEINKKMCEDLKPQTGGQRRGRKSRKHCNRKSRNRKSRRR